MALWVALSFGSSLNVHSFQVAGDAKIVVDWFNNHGKFQAGGLGHW